ncbi:hypothetical protein K438DRAFT_1990140 [Mycena galopus ATCC 62051]|nr:hypothetical protein K438DRAFT_1990140 [Mycena galopus ATCC 62051]
MSYKPVAGGITWDYETLQAVTRVLYFLDIFGGISTGLRYSAVIYLANDEENLMSFAYQAQVVVSTTEAVAKWRYVKILDLWSTVEHGNMCSTVPAKGGSTMSYKLSGDCAGFRLSLLPSHHNPVSDVARSVLLVIPGVDATYLKACGSLLSQARGLTSGTSPHPVQL